MNEQQRWWLRLGLLTELVERAPERLGRTALMKLAYLLQTVRELPLGYDFRLYTYGPFDSDVLNDLGLAETLGAVKSEIVHFPSGSGYGYEFSPGPGVEKVRKRSGESLQQFQPSLDWALQEFGKLSAADLELITTIIYADRESCLQKRPMATEELVKRVKEIKPHFSDVYIDLQIRGLLKKGLLKSIESGVGHS